MSANFSQPARRSASFRSYILMGVGLGAICAMAPGLAVAEDATTAKKAKEDADDVSQVVVTGYRKSLAEARALKRDSVIEVDAIVAEDMAKFPELNLAESLQRLPGVQISREAGEGRRISLRGLGPDFARVQLNGMEVLGNVDSAQDSRGQRSRDRAFDFNVFASELFSKVEVEKTFQAAQKEGGMAGTVGLFTSKPFDFQTGMKGAISAKVGTNQYTKDTQPRLAALLSQNWDNKFGVALSVAYGKRQTTEQGHNTYNYTQPSQGDMQSLVANGLDISHLSAAQQAKIMSGSLYFADGNRISSWDAKLERLGLTGAVQWRPVDKLLLTLDVMHSEFTTHRNELHLATRPLHGAGSTVLDTAKGSPWPAMFQTSAVVNNLAWDAANYVTMTDVSNVTFGTEHRRELNHNRFNQLALTGKWDLSDRLSIDGHLGVEKSTYTTPYDDKFYMRAKGNLIANYGSDGRSASFQYPNWSPTNAATYALDDFYYRAFNNGSQLEEGVFNLRYKVTDVWTLRAGAAYHHFSQNGANYFYDGGVNGTKGEMRGLPVTGLVDVFSNSFGSWLIGDYAAGFAKFNEYHRLAPKPGGVGGQIQDIEQVFKVHEGTASEYVQADWDTQLFGKRFRGNVGLRGYQTDTQSSGWIQGDSYAYLGSSDVKGSYSGVLPALNAVLEMTPDVLVRFSATQNLNRPTLSDMAAQGSAFQDSSSSKISASRGNPNLKPFKDDTLDVAVEYYFGKVGLLSAGVFHKRITNFIGSETLHNLPFSQTGVPFSTIPGATASTIVSDFSMPINVSGTKSLTGVELAGQGQLRFLPAPFNNLGVVGNYTYVDAPPELTGISMASYNATVYYETNLWGARVSLNHRTRWYTGHSTDPMSADTRGFEGSTYVDAAAFWNILPKLQLTLDAINLSNEKDTQFWGQHRYLYNQTQSGATYMAGLNYKF